jgi:hypothetical protein
LHYPILFGVPHVGGERQALGIARGQGRQILIDYTFETVTVETSAPAQNTTRVDGMEFVSC